MEWVMMAEWTSKQLLIAAGLSRNITRNQICLDTGCVQSYITKNLKSDEFKQLVMRFKGLPLDKDTQEYHGLTTLYKEVARLFWSESEKV